MINIDEASTGEDNTDYQWVFGFYMCGEDFDNKLIDDDVSDTVGLSNDNIKIIYLVDYDGSGNTYLFEGQNYSRSYINISEFMPYDSSELDLGSKMVFENYVNYIKKFSSESYCLVVWGHGRGYEGVCFDGSNKLSGEDIQSSLQNDRVDLIIFDECEMMSAGFLHEIIGSCDYVMGTEKDLPDRGFEYSEGISNFIKGNNNDPISMARSIMDSTRSYYQRNPSRFSLQISIVAMEDFKILSDEMNKTDFSGNAEIPSYFESGKRFDLGSFFRIYGYEKLNDLVYQCVRYQVLLQSTKGLDITDVSGISITSPDNSNSNNGLISDLKVWN